MEKLRIECRLICWKGGDDGIMREGRKNGRETYEDKDDKGDIAHRGHDYPRRQPEWNAHGEEKERVEEEEKGRWVMIYKSE